jgi:hypothetical protein
VRGEKTEETLTLNASTTYTVDFLICCIMMMMILILSIHNARCLAGNGDHPVILTPHSTYSTVLQSCPYRHRLMLFVGLSSNQSSQKSMKKAITNKSFLTQNRQNRCPNTPPGLQNGGQPCDVTNESKFTFCLDGYHSGHVLLSPRIDLTASTRKTFSSTGMGNHPHTKPPLLFDSYHRAIFRISGGLMINDSFNTLVMS